MGEVIFEIPHTYRFHSDPGHGWVEVPLNVIQYLGIAHIISECSYVRRDVAYLEEDCDASVFHKAFTDKFGREPKFEEVIYPNSDAPLRRYANYPAQGETYEAFKKFMGYN